MIRAMLAFLLILGAAGCDGGSEDKESATPAPPKPAQTSEAPVASATAPAASPVGFASASVVVVDLAGNPLMGMAPIVTRQPNAFDPPVAMGEPTNASGQGTIRFENKEHLYLRAWDPLLGYFPNNFYEVLPGGTVVEDTLTIQMVQASGLEVQLILPDGQPAANQGVELMLSHETRGPWWPARARADAEGVTRFPNLPAGEFLIELRTESGAKLQVPSTPLPPGKPVALGVLTLR